MSLTTSFVYGKRLTVYEGSEAEKFFEAVQLLNDTLNPANHPPIDLLPVLQHVPARWTSWKGRCERVKGERNDLYGGLFRGCTESLTSETSSSSFVACMLKNLDKLNMTVNDARYMSACSFCSTYPQISPYLDRLPMLSWMLVVIRPLCSS